MRRMMATLALVLALGFTALTAVAQDNSQYPSQNTPGQSGSMNNQTGQIQTISGTVVSADSKSLTITTDSGQQMKFDVVNEANMTLKHQDLKPGNRVDVSFVPQTDGKYMASDITLATGTSVTARDTRMSGMTGSQNPGMMNEKSSRTGRLPGTASPLPLVALGGLAAIAGALGLRALGKQS
jgi:hypothetical protein